MANRLVVCLLLLVCSSAKANSAALTVAEEQAAHTVVIELWEASAPLEVVRSMYASACTGYRSVIAWEGSAEVPFHALFIVPPSIPRPGIVPPFSQLSTSLCNGFCAKRHVIRPCVGLCYLLRVIARRRKQRRAGHGLPKLSARKLKPVPPYWRPVCASKEKPTPGPVL